MLTSTKVGKNPGKAVIVGMKGVGKTAILEQLIYGKTPSSTELHSTIEDIYVASVDTGKGPREIIRIFDTAGLQGNQQLPRQYLQFADGFILVYDPADPSSLDLLAGIKNDIDKNKEKKEVCIIVIANIRSSKFHRSNSQSPPASPSVIDPIESILNRANNWCSRERIKHHTVNAMERASIYEPFINLAVRLHPPQTKSSLSQLHKQLTQKSQKTDN